MSGLRGVMKEGWHPKAKDGGRESWRSDFKGINQVAGWVGMGKDTSSSVRVDRVSQPLSSLKDPASFGPPPKHGNNHEATAVPNKTTPNNRGLGALSHDRVNGGGARLQVETEENHKPAPPPVPYRIDRTGLNTDNLPPPPVRRVDSPSRTDEPRPKPKPKPKPLLPPRLPPRQDTGTPTSPSPPPPPYSATDNSGYLNRGAISSLSSAGVSVPELGIGRPETERTSNGISDAPLSPSRMVASPTNELQSRFAKMSTSNAENSGTLNSSPSQRTTLEQTPVVLKPAQDFQKERSSVPLSETRSVASTASNFRERGGSHIETGKRKISEFNQKYGITKRINNFIEDQTSPAQPEPQQVGGPAPPPPPHPNLNRSSSNVDIEALNRRKPPPPPPPPKKPEMQSMPQYAQSSQPPPLPLGTKPR